MLYHFRRWHFDLALFTGLALFAVCYWYIGPYPRWQYRIPIDPTITTHVSTLGFSPDDRFYYTLKNDYYTGSRKPQPMIQQWNVSTGDLKAEYPLQLPAGDIAQWRTLPPGVHDYCVYPLLLPQFNLIQIYQSVDRPMGLTTYRLFDVTTGECCTNMPPTIQHLHLKYLMQNPHDGHHRGCFIQKNTLEETVQLYDLTEGKVINSFKHPPGTRWQTSEL